MKALDPVHFSNLKHIARSPAHYVASLSYRKDTPAMAAGRLIHALALGGKFVVYDGERRGNAWKEFCSAHSGQEVYTTVEHARAMPVVDALWKHPLATELLRGETEREVLWRGLNGRACSSRLDVLNPVRVVDLKTAHVAEPGQFSRAALRMGYHAQMAFYLDAANWDRLDQSVSRGKEPPARIDDAYIVAVETAPPYAVVTMKLTPRAIEEGRKLCRYWMERLLGCEAADHWPGYVESTIDLDVPDELELSFGDDEAA